MLSYQHAFHAGNHADILKHYVLTFVLQALNKKEKPYTFLDSHSGSGLYDLLDNRSLKTGEAEKGIKAFYEFYRTQDSQSFIDFGTAFTDYMSLVSKYLEKKLYPGSPLIEKHFIRSQDFLFLSELHPQEVQNLKTNVGSEKNIQIHHRNGFEMLKALTPPVTKRGAVLIDPSYEELQDYIDVAKTVNLIHKKWSNGIIMVWYPLLAHRETEINEMLDSIKNFAVSQNSNIEISDIQLCVANKESHIETDLQQVLSDSDKKNPPRLYGSGMLVINSPWHLKEEAENFCNFVSNFFWKKN